jgi:hypothetical protein
MEHAFRDQLFACLIASAEAHASRSCLLGLEVGESSFANHLKQTGKVLLIGQ